jgi:SAM-dependent methyltransferase
VSPSETVGTPYDRPDLYDLVLDGLDFDIPFWTEWARQAQGPVLDVGCGTGRVLLRLLAAGIDADGLDNSEAMLARARARAEAAGHRPGLVLGDMRDFTMPRRYARVICTFNAFAHCETPDDQIAALRCMREHLEPNGALALHLSYPTPSYWSEPDGEPVLETEARHPDSGHTLQMWDTRTKDWIGQRQRSEVEIRELDPGGRLVASFRSVTTQRWCYRFELELLLRLAGFSRWELHGGFAGETLSPEHTQIVAQAWREDA